MKTIYSIGFSKKSAEEFFSLIKESKITKIIDIRRHNKSQLAGFSKGNDLKYFLRVICGAEYEHILSLAPSESLLNKYKKDFDWEYYQNKYNELLSNPNLKNSFEKILDNNNVICLLCSENEPDKCHRRLLLEYIKNNVEDIKIVHLVKR